MSSGQKSPADTRTYKPKVYLAIAIVFLTLMALVWSLDDSLVYICCGIAVYFFFLYFWKRPASQPGYTKSHHHTRSPFENFKQAFTERKQSSARPVYSQPRQADTRKMIPIAAGFVFFVFFVIIFFSIILADETDPGTNYWYQLGEEYSRNGQNDSARFYYRLALYDDPGNAETLFAYGNVFLSEDNYDSAIAYYDWALASDDYYDDARYNKALALYYQRNYDRSRDEARRIVAENPEYYGATLIIGDNFYAETKFDSAIYWYETAYSNGVRSADLCHVMAYIYDTKSNHEKSVPLYQETLYYDSSRVEIYERLAELLPNEAPNYHALVNRFRPQ